MLPPVRLTCITFALLHHIYHIVILLYPFGKNNPNFQLWSLFVGMHKNTVFILSHCDKLKLYKILDL